MRLFSVYSLSKEPVQPAHYEVDTSRQGRATAALASIGTEMGLTGSPSIMTLLLCCRRLVLIISSQKSFQHTNSQASLALFDLTLGLTTSTYLHFPRDSGRALVVIPDLCNVLPLSIRSKDAKPSAHGRLLSTKPAQQTRIAPCKQLWRSPQARLIRVRVGCWQEGSPPTPAVNRFLTFNISRFLCAFTSVSLCDEALQAHQPLHAMKNNPLCQKFQHSCIRPVEFHVR